MKKLLTLSAILVLLAGYGLAANTPPVGSTGDLITNGGGGKFGHYVLGPSMSVTTSGGQSYLNSTATGTVTLPVPVASGGTGATSLDSTLVNLGGVFGTTVIPVFYSVDHTVLSSEAGGLLSLSGSTTRTFTLAQAGSAGFETGKAFNFNDTGTANLVLATSGTSVFVGSALSFGNIVLLPNTGASCVADTNSNWDCIVSSASSGASGVSTTPLAFGVLTATITPDFALSTNFFTTLVHANTPFTLANPSGTVTPGQRGVFSLTQSTSGTDTIGTYGSSYDVPNGGLTLSTTGSLTDDIPYYVADATHIHLGPVLKGLTAIAPTCSYPLPLGTTAAAYGFRKLAIAYAGHAVRLQRASDSTTLDVDFNSNNCDFDTSSATTFCAATTCGVAIWYDQSGNGANLVQSTLANQPTVTLSCQNSQPCAVFNGTSMVMSGTLASGITSRTFAAIAKTGTLATSHSLVTMGTDGSNFLDLRYNLSSTKCAQIRAVGGVFGSATESCSASTAYRWIGTATNTLSSMYLAGSIGTDDTTSMTLASHTALVLGGSVTGAASWNGNVSELIVFGPSLSIGNSNTVSSNQGTYWGL